MPTEQTKCPGCGKHDALVRHGHFSTLTENGACDDLNEIEAIHCGYCGRVYTPDDEEWGEEAEG